MHLTSHNETRLNLYDLKFAQETFWRHTDRSFRDFFPCPINDILSRCLDRFAKAGKKPTTSVAWILHNTMRRWLVVFKAEAVYWEIIVSCVQLGGHLFVCFCRQVVRGRCKNKNKNSLTIIISCLALLHLTIEIITPFEFSHK